jgi:hypothetical protein
LALFLLLEIGQTLLEKHDLYVTQSQDKIHELHERCRQDEERIAELIRTRDRWQRTAEAATHERDALDEERVRSEQASIIRLCTKVNVTNELSRLYEQWRQNNLVYAVN